MKDDHILTTTSLVHQERVPRELPYNLSLTDDENLAVKAYEPFCVGKVRV